MKTINTYILAGTLLLAGAFLAGCSKATDSLKPEAAQTSNEFTLKVRSINTKALADLGETLGSEWTQGDSVRVYNATTKQNIEGFLFAEAGGTTTTFSGTVAGNFNQGDVLRLSFLSDNYAQQDGTLEGVASQCDYAVADVEILEIDPEAKTITTEVAEFVKQQAVVKFNLTNRKDPVGDLDVKAFYGFGVLPGSETPFGILVKPAAATNELYVAIPYLKDMEITFEALGADGYYYRLIVPSVTFEDGLYYRRQLNMKRKALVKAPVAKTNLTYNTQPQALVDSAHVYWTVNNQEVILDDDLDYQNKKCVISYFVKKEVTAGTTPEAPSASENGWVSSIPTRTDAGTYYVWTKMTGNYDYEDVGVSTTPVKKVVIAKATPSVTAPTSKAPTFNGTSSNPSGSAQVLVNAASTTGGTIQYKVDSGSWSTNLPSGTNAGSYTVYYKVVGDSNYEDVEADSITVNMAKANGWCSVSPTSNYFNNHGEICYITISCHGGELTHNSQYYYVNFNGTTSGTIQHKSSAGSNWNETITITSAGTSNYKSASCTFIGS